MAAGLLLALSYGAFLAAHLPPTAMEQAYRAGDGAAVFAFVLAGVTAVAGDDLFALRMVSVAAAGIAMLATAWLGRKAADDPLTGAGLTLGWVLFPPLTATLALATPHVLIAALTAGGLALAWPVRGGAVGARKASTAAWIAAVLLALAALLHPVGALAVLMAVLVAAIAQGRVGWTAVLPAAAAVLTLVAARTAPRDDVFVEPPHDGLLYAFVLPYVLLIAAIILAWLASLTSTVRQVLGARGIWACRSASVASVAALSLAATALHFTAGQFLTGMGFLFAIALPGALPLVVWIRFAMPRVRNRAAWILFPVLMYSAFWLALGPVKPSTFPYRLLHYNRGQSKYGQFYSDPDCNVCALTAW
jgi:hypothetical protein